MNKSRLSFSPFGFILIERKLNSNNIKILGETLQIECNKVTCMITFYLTKELNNEHWN